MSGQLHVPAALTQEKKPQVRIGYEVDRIPEPVLAIWRTENF
jgi:hypothetical protein